MRKPKTFFCAGLSISFLDDIHAFGVNDILYIVASKLRTSPVFFPWSSQMCRQVSLSWYGMSFRAPSLLSTHRDIPWREVQQSLLPERRQRLQPRSRSLLYRSVGEIRDRIDIVVESHGIRRDRSYRRWWGTFHHRPLRTWERGHEFWRSPGSRHSSRW